jgi:hypothetical protein
VVILYDVVLEVLAMVMMVVGEVLKLLPLLNQSLSLTNPVIETRRIENLSLF